MALKRRPVPEEWQQTVRRDPVAIVTVAQGGYFLVTGVWPLVSMRSFELITSPKVDKWLVKTIGALIAVVGASLLVAGARQRIAPELALLASDPRPALPRRIPLRIPFTHCAVGSRACTCLMPALSWG